MVSMSNSMKARAYLLLGVMLLAAAAIIETVSAAHNIAVIVGMTGAFTLVGWASEVKRSRANRDRNTN